MKDHWESAYKNFLHVLYFWVFLLIASAAMWFLGYKPFMQQFDTVASVWHILWFLFSGVFWFALSRLFKQRNKNAILIGYISQGIIAAGILLGGGYIAVLIPLYFIWLIYKAS